VSPTGQMQHMSSLFDKQRMVDKLTDTK